MYMSRSHPGGWGLGHWVAALRRGVRPLESCSVRAPWAGWLAGGLKRHDTTDAAGCPPTTATTLSAQVRHGTRTETRNALRLSIADAHR